MLILSKVDVCIPADQLHCLSGDLPGHNRRLDSWPADCPYLMSLMLLVALLDFLVARAHLLDCLPIHLRMICGCEALPA